MVARVQGSEFSEFGMIHVDNNISQRLECKKKPSKTVQGARYRVKTLIYIYIYNVHSGKADRARSKSISSR